MAKRKSNGGVATVETETKKPEKRGESPEVMTSMEALLGRPIPMDGVRDRVRAWLAGVFELTEVCSAST